MKTTNKRCRRFIIIVVILVGLVGSMYCWQRNKEGKENRSEADSEALVKGLTLKFSLVDTLCEIYTVMVSHPEYASIYSKDEIKAAHYNWMNETWNHMDELIKEEIIEYMPKCPHWYMQDATKELSDDATVEKIVDALVQYESFPFEGEEKERFKQMVNQFYREYYKAYYEQMKPLYDEKATEYTKELQDKQFNIMRFMEEKSGVKFTEDYIPRFYLMQHGVSALGLFVDRYYISSLRIEDSLVDALSVPFHEFSHNLFRTFTDSDAFKKVAEQLAKAKPEVYEEWEKKWSYDYDWKGYCEENLVEGFAKYLYEEYSDKIANKDDYTYSTSFYNYLKENAFSPAKMSLEDISLSFYKDIIKAEWELKGKTVFQADLVCHILNYIPLEDSPADLYSKDYIEKFEAFRSTKSNNGYKLIEEAGKLSTAYKKYFDEVCNIAFIGFYSSSYEDLINQLNSMPLSTEAKEAFLLPFIQCMDAELEIYTEYWNMVIAEQKDTMDAFINYANKELCSFTNVFRYAGKKPLYYFCVSLREGKGRGITSDQFLGAAGCIPQNEKEQQNGFFQAFHEMTHQITDQKVFTNINMEDGTHLLSEKVVMNTDYYLIQKFNEDLLDDYIRWEAYLAGRGEMNTIDFLTYYQLPNQEGKQVQAIIDDIMNIE